MSNVEQGLLHFKPEAAMLSHGFVDSSIIVNTTTGLIEAVGSESDLRQNFDFEQIEGTIEGDQLLPAFTDAHDHVLPDAYSLIMQDPRVDDCPDKETLLAKLRANYERRIDEGYEGHIIARGLDSRITLDSHDLDTVCPNLPLMVLDPSNHGGVLNSQSAGIVQRILLGNSDTPSGHLTQSGHATEGYLTLAKEAAIAALPEETVIEALEQVLHSRGGHGTIAVHDMGLRDKREIGIVSTLKEYWEEKYRTPFPIKRAYVFPSLHSPSPAEEIKAAIDENLITEKDLQWLGLKLFIDGSFGSRSALLTTPYRDQPHNFGARSQVLRQIWPMLEEAAALGIEELAIHAIGDEAILDSLDIASIWQKLALKHRSQPQRIARLEHFELPTAKDKIYGGTTINLARRLDCWVGPQPNFMTDYIYKDRLGDRVKKSIPSALSMKKRLR